MNVAPYWTATRIRCRCTQCERELERGARVFYVPRTDSVYCDAPACGKQESALFVAAQFDAEFMNSQPVSDKLPRKDFSSF